MPRKKKSPVAPAHRNMPPRYPLYPDRPCPADFAAAHLPFVPDLPGEYTLSPSFNDCCYSVSEDPQEDMPIPGDPWRGRGRYADLRIGRHSLISRTGPLRAVYDRASAVAMVRKAVDEVLADVIAAAKADGWTTAWDDTNPLPFLIWDAVLRRDEWTMRMQGRVFEVSGWVHVMAKLE